MVEKATGRRDQYIDPAVDQRILLLEADTADQQRFRELDVSRVGVEAFGDLRSKFSCRAEDK